MEQYGEEQWQEEDWGDYGEEDDFMLSEPVMIKQESQEIKVGEQDMFTTKTINDLYKMVDATSISSIQ